MPDSRPSFLDRYSPAPAAPDAEGDPLPKVDDKYKPLSRRSNQDEHALHFIAPSGTIRSLQYQHLDEGFYSSECITLTFMGIRPKRVTIYGRNLPRDAYEQILDRRTRWVRQAPRDFAEDGETIVIDVAIANLKEDGEGVLAVAAHETQE